MPGIRIEDMGTKTIANDLDNARVWFDKVRLPKNSLLNKFADVVGNEYVRCTCFQSRAPPGFAIVLRHVHLCVFFFWGGG